MREKVEKSLESLLDALNSYFDNGIDKVCTDEAGKVADMIKDLSEAWYHLKA